MRLDLKSAVLIAALIAGVTYMGSWFLPLPAVASIAWKGAGVGLLAVYAALGARRIDGWLLAGVMVFGALGDILLEVKFVIGGAAFLLGHLTAIALYLRNRRAPLIAAEWVIAAALLVLIPLAAYALPVVRATAAPIAVYAIGLSAMTAAAWLSRFPRPLVAAGAMMFAVSDLIIFARGGRPGLDILPVNVAVWSLYLAGQTLITLGVVRTTRD
jgi:uncharacterized membrane protein YhhN